MLIDIYPHFSVEEVRHALSTLGEVKLHPEADRETGVHYVLVPHYRDKETIRKRLVAMAEQAAREAE